MIQNAPLLLEKKQAPRQVSHGLGLLLFTVLTFGLAAGSWFGLRAVNPLLLDYWGYLLAAKLLSWAGVSLWRLQKQAPKMVRVLIAVTLVLAIVIGVVLPISGLIAAVAIIPISGALLLLLALGVGIGRLWYRTSPVWLLLGFTPFLAALLIVGVSSFVYAQPAVPPATLTVTQQLQQMHATDQVDRQTGRFLLDSSRDKVRLARVQTLDRQGLIVQPVDQYHAALILQHGQCADSYRRAYALAAAAVQGGYNDAEWLRQATYDRWQLASGKPQHYGTQRMVAVEANCEQGEE